MKTIRVLFVAVLALTLGMQAEAKKVKLQYKLNAGDEFKYESSSKQDVTQEAMGQTQTTSISNSTTYHFKVTGVGEGGNMTLQAAMVEFSLNTTSPMGEMKYNSATDSIVPEEQKLLSVSLNEYYTFTLSPVGKISEVIAPAGLEEKVKQIADAQGLGQMMSLMGQLNQSTSAEGFQKLLESFFLTFPEDGVEIKKPWEVDAKVSGMMAMQVRSKFELEKASKTTNQIKISATIAQDPDAAPIEMQGMNLTMELNGAKEGTLILDANTGLVVTNDGVTSISGSMSIDSPQLPAPMTIPMTVRSVEKMIRK